MTRRETQNAIEQISDTLHLPLQNARVVRFDIGENFIIKRPIQEYFNHLGELKHAKRATVINGGIETLYYYQSGGALVFYDKIREQKEKREPIPDMYTNRCLLRYEQRSKGRLGNTFNCERVTGAMLYDEQFYTGAIKRWRDSFRAIKKINDKNIEFEAMRTKRDLYTMSVLYFVESHGGELSVLSQIAVAQKAGTLSKKQAYDMKQAVREACSVQTAFTAKNDAMIELEKKMDEAVRFYR
jgi:hypothetical protein